MPHPYSFLSSSALYDDGSGPWLHLGGEGGFPLPIPFELKGLARIQGDQFEIVPGLEGPDPTFSLAILAMIVHDDGSGPVLYVGGVISFAGGQLAINVARWNGREWSGVGAGLLGPTGVESVRDFAVFDEDGEGPLPPRLFATGFFQFSNGDPVNGIARWDGVSWTPLGDGLAPLNDTSYGGSDLVAVDEGPDRGLYVGGRFATAGGVAANSVARWDGQSWHALGDGLPPSSGSSTPSLVYSLAWFDDGEGHELYAGGSFEANTATGMERALARWDGESWKGFGISSGANPPYPYIRCMAPFTSGDTRQLVMGGALSSNGLNARVYVLADGAIAPVPQQLSNTAVSGYAHSILSADSIEINDEPYIVLTGLFNELDGDTAVQNAVKWDGQQLSPIIEGDGIDGEVNAVAFSEGGSNELVVGGRFISAGDRVAENVAAFDGESWSTLGDGLNNAVHALAAHETSSGPRVFAGGAFDGTGGVVFGRGLAMFDGATWSNFAPINSGTVLALASIDGDLYAGGDFSTIGGVSSRWISRWDGAAWRALGEGLTGGVSVNAIAAWNGGVVVGGFFTRSGTTTLNGVGFWDGESWHAMGAGFNSYVRSLAVYQGQLYAAGDFSFSGSEPVRRIARWNGQSWEALPGLMSSSVRAMSVFDDGAGPALFVGGAFATIVPQSVNYIARWDGADWTPLEMGLDAPVNALAVADLADGPALYAGGSFTHASGQASYGVARWSRCMASCAGDVDGDGMVDMHDLMRVVDGFNAVEGEPLFDEDADLNHNGQVEFSDLNLVLSGYHLQCN